MISEAPPNELKDYFYAKGIPFDMQTTVQAFQEAGFQVSSMKDVLNWEFTLLQPSSVERPATPCPLKLWKIAQAFLRVK